MDDNSLCDIFDDKEFGSDHFGGDENEKGTKKWSSQDQEKIGDEKGVNMRGGCWCDRD